MALDDKDYEIRIITLGDPGVGKTSIFKRLPIISLMKILCLQ